MGEQEVVLGEVGVAGRLGLPHGFLLSRLEELVDVTFSKEPCFFKELSKESCFFKEFSNDGCFLKLLSKEFCFLNELSNDPCFFMALDSIDD